MCFKLFGRHFFIGNYLELASRCMKKIFFVRMFDLPGENLCFACTSGARLTKSNSVGRTINSLSFFRNPAVSTMPCILLATSTADANDY